MFEELYLLSDLSTASNAKIKTEDIWNTKLDFIGCAYFGLWGGGWGEGRMFAQIARRFSSTCVEGLKDPEISRL